MNSEIESLIANVMSPSNEARSQAEAKVKELRTSSAETFLNQLVEFAVSCQDVVKSSFAHLLIKKQFLDDREEEEGLWKMSPEQTAQLKDKISQSIDFVAQPSSLLKRKADIICKCFRKLETYPEMIQNLVSVLSRTEGSQEELVKSKQFAMYNFEVLSEFHLSQELIVEHSEQFIQLFTATLQEKDILVRVAALKAISCFLSSIDDESVVLKYKQMMEGLLQVVIEVMQQDEEQGQASLEALIELTATHGDIWGSSVQKLIYVISEIIKNRQFEEATRQSALEIISTLAENMPPILRKHSDDLRDHLFPAIAFMMTEVELADDLPAWFALEDTEIQAKNDPAAVAADALSRMASYLGEKTTLHCSIHLVKSAIESSEWKEQCMGFSFLGMISDACKKQFKSNIDDVAKMTVSGFRNENPRVRFEALQSTGLLLNDLAPVLQSKYHADLFPALIGMMNSETEMKMQYQATACMTSMIRGLIDEETAEDSEVNTHNKGLLVPYADDLVNSISALF